ncbi:hypothetical protein DQ04_19871020, partial [Trypanosoma grayi]|uniref:hypothetical protein n=1 Tax=Trypanosoma grayi TaxID=71804 RepID=UPI0004F49123
IYIYIYIYIYAPSPDKYQTAIVTSYSLCGRAETNVISSCCTHETSASTVRGGAAADSAAASAALSAGCTTACGQRAMISPYNARHADTGSAAAAVAATPSAMSPPRSAESTGPGNFAQ